MLDQPVSDIVTAVLLIASTAFFATMGIRVGSRDKGLDDYLVARNSFGAGTTTATLLASMFGAWLLFSPAEAATWGGVVALFGYALGVALPRFSMIPLGSRMRRLMPYGRSLSEFVHARYGQALHVVVLIVMIAYLAVIIAAEASATVRVIGAVSTLPAWLPAGITLAATVLYTGIGGLRASIVTDRAQMFVIIPFLAVIAGLGLWIFADAWADPAMAQRISTTFSMESAKAWEFAGALSLAILFPGLLNQGNWQRVFAVESPTAMRKSMIWAGLIAPPVVFLMGAFGLLHQMLGLNQPSAAVFEVLKVAVPGWALIALAILAVALVLSTMDTALSAIASIAIVTIRAVRPDWSAARLVKISVIVMAVSAVIALVVAMQGWSVLYLFLTADLLCAAAAVPVFAGLFLERYGAKLALFSLAVGLASGFSFFPGPSLIGGSLFWAFAVAFSVPLALVPICLLPRAPRFDFLMLNTRVRPYTD